MADITMENTAPSTKPSTPRAPRNRASGGGRNRGLPYARPAPRPTAAAEPATSSGPSTRLLVSNLHYEVTQQDLLTIFEPFGTLAKAPALRFDRSGRSTGVAHVAYDRHEDALQAKKQLDGQNAKGQPISIRFEAAFVPPAGPRATAGLPTGPKGAGSKSLLSRLNDTGGGSRGSLLQRMQQPTAEAAAAATNGVGPIRTRQTRQARPAPAAARTAPAARAKPKALTTTDLDQELEAYLASDKGKGAQTAAAKDVEMAV